jgi:hypothetical protein
MFNKYPYVIVAFFVIIIIAVAFFALGNSDEKIELISSNNVAQPDDLKFNGSNNNISTIAKQWQWTELNTQQDQPIKIEIAEKALPFTAKFVYEALKAVKLDRDGNVIHDHDALLSLDEALLRIQSKLDTESLSILQQIIKDGLPGKAGEQTAKIVGDYYYFLEAKDEFSETSEALSDLSVHDTAGAVENDELLYAELQALRDVHLGSDVSTGLFRVSDASAQYMFDSMKLDFDQNMTEMDKQKIRLEIEEKHIRGSVNVSDWPARYGAFEDAKQKILTTSLQPEEKQRQVTELLQSYFSSDELNRIQYLSLDTL